MYILDNQFLGWNQKVKERTFSEKENIYFLDQKMNGEGKGGKYFEKGKYFICRGEEKRADIQNCEDSS